MRTRGFVLGLALILAATVVGAQEPAESKDTQPPEPLYRIRVLQNPYDLASFYRGENQGGFFAEAADRYAIASYYRGGESATGYSRFWTSGYGARPQGVMLVPGQDYRRRIGQNGDIFLLVPGFLAPVGPLTDAYLGGR